MFMGQRKTIHEVILQFWAIQLEVATSSEIGQNEEMRTKRVYWPYVRSWVSNIWPNKKLNRKKKGTERNFRLQIVKVAITWWIQHGIERFWHTHGLQAQGYPYMKKHYILARTRWNCNFIWTDSNWGRITFLGSLPPVLILYVIKSLKSHVKWSKNEEWRWNLSFIFKLQILAKGIKIHLHSHLQTSRRLRSSL